MVTATLWHWLAITQQNPTCLGFCRIIRLDLRRLLRLALETSGLTAKAKRRNWIQSSPWKQRNLFGILSSVSTTKQRNRSGWYKNSQLAIVYFYWDQNFPPNSELRQWITATGYAIPYPLHKFKKISQFFSRIGQPDSTSQNYRFLAYQILLSLIALPT